MEVAGKPWPVECESMHLVVAVLRAWGTRRDSRLSRAFGVGRREGALSALSMARRVRHVVRCSELGLL